MFQWQTSSSLDKIAYLGLHLQERRLCIQQLEQYYRGNQPSTYLPPELLAQLGNRMVNLNINYCRKTVTSLTERLKVTGFRVDGAATADAELWQAWTRNRMPVRSVWALRDALSLGAGYLSIWAANGVPRIAVESPHQMVPYIDPVTREPLGYLKQWSAYDDLTNTGQSYSVLYLPDRTETYLSDSPSPPNSIPASGWILQNVIPNPLGVLPIVQLLNASDTLDFYGESEFSDVIPLVDWLNKSCLDLAAASDSAGTPRKFLSGLTIQLDDSGEPVDPFSQEKNRVWMSENPDARMTQYDGAQLTNFVAEAEFIIRQIAIVSNIPQYQLGLAVQPTSADGVRAQNLSLTTSAESKITLFDGAFARAGQLMRAIETGQNPDAITVSPIWRPVEDKAESAGTDSVSKLVAAGVPLRTALQIMLGWTDEQLNQIDTIGSDAA